MEVFFLVCYLTFWALFGIIAVVALLWSIYKRLQEKKEEDFEDRKY